MTDTIVAPFTTRTRITLAIARGIAASLGHDDLAPVHIALGLLHEGSNPAVAALQRAGVALGAIRSELEAALRPRGRIRPREVALALTPGEQNVVDQASAEGRLRNDEYLGPHHLLLAILRDASSPTAQVFARHGFGFDAAATHLQSVLGGHTGPPGPGASDPAV